MAPTYESLGVTFDPSVVGDWLLYYRMVNKHYWGRAVSRIPEEISLGATMICETALVAYYITPDNYLQITDGRRLRLKGEVRTLKYESVNEAVYLLTESGKVYWCREGTIKLFQIAILGPIVEFMADEYGITYMTRAGAIGHYEFDVVATAPPPRSLNAVKLYRSGLYSYIDRMGRPHLIGQDPNATDELADQEYPPIIDFIPHSDQLMLTIGGKFMEHSEYLDVSPVLLSNDTYITIASMDFEWVNIYLLSATRELYQYKGASYDDEDIPRVAGTIPYAGRIQMFTKNYLLVDS